VSYIDTLLRQATLGKLNLKNRIVRSATMLSGAEEKTGKPSDKLIGRYKELAAGGVGLIITGHLYVSPQGQASPRQVSISSDENVPELAKLVEAVHEFGLSHNFSDIPCRCGRHEKGRRARTGPVRS